MTEKDIDKANHDANCLLQDLKEIHDSLNNLALVVSVSEMIKKATAIACELKELQVYFSKSS